MIKYTLEDVQLAYKKSSPKIQQILDGGWVTSVCGEIGKDMNLRIDAIDSMIRVTGLTLLNIVSISSFVKTLEGELGVSSANATTVAKRIDELIFKKIRDIIINEDEGHVPEDVYSLEDQIKDEKKANLIDDIENRADDNVSFKDRFNKVIVREKEDRVVDPYRESI